MEVSFEEDIATIYSEDREGNISVKESKELIRILKKYLKMRMSSREVYAIELSSLGIFYRELDLDEYIKKTNRKNKELKLEDEIMVNSLYKRAPKKQYKKEEIEAVKEDSYNNPIKD